MPPPSMLVVAGRRVESGDNRDHDGRGRRHRGLVGALTSRRPEDDRGADRRGPRGSKPWIGASIDLQLDAQGRGRVAEGPITTVPYEPRLELLSPRSSTAPSPATPAPRRRGGHGDRRQGGAQLPPRRDRGRAPGRARGSPTTPPARSPDAAGGVRKAFRALQKKSCATASWPRASASTGGAPPTSGPCRRRSASCPPPTAAVCSSAARRRCCRSRRSACPAWSRCSTRSASTTPSATCTTTTSRRSPPARRAGWVRRSVVRSVTVRWPSGR